MKQQLGRLQKIRQCLTDKSLWYSETTE